MPGWGGTQILAHTRKGKKTSAKKKKTPGKDSNKSAETSYATK